MSTKNPNPSSHSRETNSPETRLTYNELLELSTIVMIDLTEAQVRLKLLKQAKPGSTELPHLVERVKSQRALVDRLELMRTEAYVRELRHRRQ